MHGDRRFLSLSYVWNSLTFIGDSFLYILTGDSLLYSAKSKLFKKLYFLFLRIVLCLFLFYFWVEVPRLSSELSSSITCMDFIGDGIA